MAWGIALALALAAGAPFSIDDLLALPRVSAPALSPDGATVAFAVARASPDGGAMDSALFVVSSTGGEPRRITPPELSGYAPRFSPDGKAIAFVGVAAGDAQGWVVEAAGGAPRKVSAVPGGVDAVGWMPDGRSLLAIVSVAPGCGADPKCSEAAFKASEGRPRVATELLFRHWDSWRIGLRSHVFRIPLDGGPPADLTPGDRDVPPWQRGGLSDLAVSPDGKTLYFTAITDPVEAISTNADLYAVPIAGGAPVRLSSGKGWDGAPRPSPDGKRLAWRSLERPGFESDRGRILLASADGSGAREALPGLEHSVDDLYWTEDGKAIRFLAQHQGRRRLFELQLATGKVALLTGDLNVVDLSATPDGRKAAVILSSFTQPPELHLLEPARAEPPLAPRRLTFLTRDVMGRVALGTVSPFKARSKDGSSVPGWIVRPPGLPPGAKPPGVLLMHGGPEDAWLDEWHWRWNAMLWTAQGYALVMPNPRGSTGYGQRWVDAVRKDWNGAPLDDALAFLDAAIASGHLDAGRTCAAGASYGGYLAHVLNGRTDRFKCLVSHASLFDVELAWYGTDELWFAEWEFGGLPWEQEATLARNSPRRAVARWRTPSLVSHGELDYRVALGQAIGAFQALQRRGIPSRLVTFPDEGHWILKPRNVRAFHEEVFGWIRRWVPPAEAPAAAPRK